MRTLAFENGRFGITANSVAPGWIETASSTPDENTAGHHTPIGRPGTPDEVAGLIAYLASEPASYVTGQSVVVDGGNMIQEPPGVDLYDADDTDTYSRPVASESVLGAPPPRFTAEEIETIAAELFGLRGQASDLGSERDQTFLIDDGAEGGVLKISNLGEDGDVLDLEARAIEYISRVDPDLPVARLRGSGTYDGHFVRLFERLLGHEGGPELD